MINEFSTCFVVDVYKRDVDGLLCFKKGSSTILPSPVKINVTNSLNDLTTVPAMSVQVLSSCAACLIWAITPDGMEEGSTPS